MYRIYTEDINHEQTIKLASEYFKSFTVMPSVTGYWNGEAESSLVFEIATNNRNDIYDLAKRIKEQNHQQAVLVTEQLSQEILI